MAGIRPLAQAGMLQKWCFDPRKTLGVGPDALLATIASPIETENRKLVPEN
jgi:hypothetical protein